jgi:cytochrome b
MALRGGKPGMRLPMRVWDLPTRVLHWLIVVLVAASYLSQRLGDMGVHKLLGYTMLTVLLFRLAWGFVGSDTARFGKFLRSPLAGLQHLARLNRVEPDNEVGHNAAGGWMVLLMLALLAAQVGTGLFSNSDVYYVDGPLKKYVSQHTSDLLSSVHGTLFWVLVAAIALHVAVVAVYVFVKRQNLVRPMVTGKKMLPAATRAPRMAPLPLALAVLAVAALLVVILVTRA